MGQFSALQRPEETLRSRDLKGKKSQKSANLYQNSFFLKKQNVLARKAVLFRTSRIRDKHYGNFGNEI